MMYKKLICLLAIALTTVACDKEPDITDAMLDGEVIFDPSLYQPENYLVSAKYPNPTPEDLDKHIIIALHGYTATTFEWQEFADWTNNEFGDSGTYRVSQVLLDGHGTTYEDFKKHHLGRLARFCYDRI